MYFFLNFPGSLIFGLPAAALVGMFFGWLIIRTISKWP